MSTAFSVKFSRYLLWMFRIFSLLILLAYLSLFFVYFISPLQVWPIGILGIGFVYLCIAVLVLSIAWIFINKSIATVFAGAFLVGLFITNHVLALRTEKFDLIKKTGSLRIMQWNCMNLPGINPLSIEAPQRSAAVTMLQTYNPDLICIQDFTNVIVDIPYNNLLLLTDTLGYKYFSFNIYYDEKQAWGEKKSGTAIFSKLPFLDSGQLKYSGKQYPEGICWVDINFDGKPLRIASTHLQSMNLKRPATGAILNYFQYEDSAAINHYSPINRLRYFQAYHVVQAKTLAAFLDTCESPLVLGADLNSVPVSYVYGLVSNHLQDAFLVKGAGLGGSYHTRFHGIRIDYLFASHDLRIQQFKNIKVGFFDHNPQVMDIQLR